MNKLDILIFVSKYFIFVSLIYSFEHILAFNRR